MTAEELENAMAQQPPVQRQQSPAGVSVGEVLPMVRPIQRTADEADAARGRAKEARREAWRAEIAHERAKLAPRIDRRLLTRIVAGRSPCSLLLGPTGTGKTSAMHWLKPEFGGAILHARELGSCERRHGLGEGYPPEMHTMRSECVLYLDDIGAEEARDLGVIQYAIEYRYARGMATVASTGLGKNELSAHLGAAYVRRLVEQHVPRRSGGEWPVLVVDLF
jgi:hypothetical protein